MSRSRSARSIDGRFILLGILVLIVAAGIFFYMRDAARRRAAAVEPAKPAGLASDLDGDGLPDPLPIRRLGANPAAAPVLDAITKMGGWRASSAQDTISCVAENVFFRPGGMIAERRSERWEWTLQGQPRIRIEEDDQRRSGIGRDGAWSRGALESGPGTNAGPTADEEAVLTGQLLQTIRLLRFPFNLGEVEVTLHAGEETEGDSLLRVIAAWPPSPGTSTGREMILGFSPDDSLLHDIRWTEPGGEHGLPTDMEMELFDWSPEEGFWIAHRRRLIDLSFFPGTQLIRAEQQLRDFNFHPDPDSVSFEPPEGP